MRFVDLFAGIGGFHYAVKRVWPDAECVFASEKDKHAAETYRINHGIDPLNDITQTDIASLPDADLVCAGFPCFVAGSMVLTRKGYLPIEDVRVGDEVLTHKGRWRKVNATMKRNGAALYSFKVSGIEIVTTAKHPFLVRNRYKQYAGSKRYFDDPKWVSTLELDKSCFVGQVMPKAAKNNKSASFWWLVGRYLADGWRVERKSRPKGSGRVVLCSAKHEYDELSVRIREAGYNFCLVEECTVYKYHITNNALYQFLEPFGHGAKGKRLTGQALSLNQELSTSLLEGYLSGDGHARTNPEGWVGDTISKSLALSVALLGQKVFGTVAGVRLTQVPKTKIIEGRVVNQNPIYTVMIPLRNKTHFIDGRYGWKQIKSIPQKCGNGTVYNIAVEEDESYIVDGVIAHNCQPFSKNGKWYNAGKVVGNDDRANLFSYVVEYLRLHRPQLALLENVKGLTKIANEDGTSYLDRILSELRHLGYYVQHKVLDSADYGLPQQRQRTYIVCIWDLSVEHRFQWPEPQPRDTCIFDILDEEVDPKYHLENRWQGRMCKQLEGTRFEQLHRAYRLRYNPLVIETGRIQPVAIITGDTPSGAPRQQDKLYSGYGISPTIATMNLSIPNINTYPWRVLTPRECARLQGFPESLVLPSNDNFAYRQVGNAISVPVAAAVLRRLGV